MSRSTSEPGRGLLGELRTAGGFLTVLGGAGTTPSGETLVVFPLVGLLLGLGLGGCWKLARRVLPSLAAAAVIVTGDVVVTGALHLDGLADSADGLLAHAPAPSRLAIMAEPQLGTFGTTALCLTLLLRVAAFASLRPDVALCGAAGCLSRSVMVLGTEFAGPYVREGGIAGPFLLKSGANRRAAAAGIGGVAISLLLGAVSRGRSGLGAVLFGGLAGGAVLALGRARLGGFTGDLLGAAGVTAETVTLLGALRP